MEEEQGRLGRELVINECSVGGVKAVLSRLVSQKPSRIRSEILN